MMNLVRCDNSSQTADCSFKVMHSKTINVLMVGRSGVGKTTIINTLINENAFVESTMGYSETRGPSWHTCVLFKATSDVGYQLNILETPGLQEYNKDPIMNCTDEALLNLAAQCVEKNILSLNVICFITVAGKTFEQDVQIFKAQQESLGPNFCSNAMIILTHCEQIPDTQFELYKNDLRQHPDTKDVYEYCQLGVFGYGAVNKNHFVDMEDEIRDKVIAVRRKKTAERRNKLLETFVYCADQPVPVVELEKLRKQYDEDLQERMKKEKERKEKENPRKLEKCPIV